MSVHSIVQEILDKLCDAGITVSLVYGRCGSLGRYWSVNVLTEDAKEFVLPYAAESILHAAQIAMKECEERGWIQIVKVE